MMLDFSNFKNWLAASSGYSKETVSNVISRLKRADAILPWFHDEVYLFRLEQTEEYMGLSLSRKRLSCILNIYNSNLIDM